MSKSMPDELFEVEKLLGRRIRDGKVQYLVKWKRFGKLHNSWEPVRNLDFRVNRRKAKKQGPPRNTARKLKTNPTTKSGPCGGNPPATTSNANDEEESGDQQIDPKETDSDFVTAEQPMISVLCLPSYFYA